MNSWVINKNQPLKEEKYARKKRKIISLRNFLKSKSRSSRHLKESGHATNQIKELDKTAYMTRKQINENLKITFKKLKMDLL